MPYSTTGRPARPHILVVGHMHSHGQVSSDHVVACPRKLTSEKTQQSYVASHLDALLDGAGGVDGLLWITLHPGSGAGAGTHFCAYDGNGNVVALASATDGLPTARYEYGPFGQPIRITGPAAALNPFPFLDQAHRQHDGLGALRISGVRSQPRPVGQ